MIRHAKSVAELIRFNFVHFLCTRKLFFKSEKAGSREGRVDKILEIVLSVSSLLALNQEQFNKGTFFIVCF